VNVQFGFRRSARLNHVFVALTVGKFPAVLVENNAHLCVGAKVVSFIGKRGAQRRGERPSIQGILYAAVTVIYDRKPVTGAELEAVDKGLIQKILFRIQEKRRNSELLRITANGCVYVKIELSFKRQDFRTSKAQQQVQPHGETFVIDDQNPQGIKIEIGGTLGTDHQIRLDENFQAA